MAYNAGMIGTGAGLGLGIGALLAGPTGGLSLIPALAAGGATGGIGGALAGLFGGDEGTPAQPGGAQWLQNPQYPQVPGAIGGAWDYVSQGLQALQEGKPPTWYQQFRPLEEYQRKNALTGTYYGSQAGAGGHNLFGPGVLASQQAADVKAGRRGAGAGSNYAKQLQSYAQGMQDIDDYLTKLGATSMADSEKTYLNSMSTLPQGPQGQWYSYGATPYQPSGFESLSQGLGSLAPYSLMGSMNQPAAVTPGVQSAQTVQQQQQQDQLNMLMSYILQTQNQPVNTIAPAGRQ